MADNLVGYSRAGDTFHYRWAARRSLKLIYPNSPLSVLVVEGSNDKIRAGEYVIDLAEYYGDESAPTAIIYYQLKHTTTQKNKAFQISDLRDTFIGFGEKFTERQKKNEIVSKGVKFSIVTNRAFDKKFKQNLIDIAAGICTDKRFINTISKYTKLNITELATFCSILNVEDAEGDYSVQEQDLRIEIARLIAGNVDNSQLSSLTDLMSKKALPNSNGIVLREEVLKCFGYESESELYPAKPIWEPSGPIVNREIYKELLFKIVGAAQAVIVHAPGGVGKSVFTRYSIDNLDEGSEIIAYDCFGAGSYRNRSKSRHRHRDALVEIANELAAKGLCDPLYIMNGTHDTEMIRSFVKRIESAVAAIKSAYPNGMLFLLIDAADNAEMAAKELNDVCFASELLREKLPDGCKLVYLCRTERIDLLKPESYVIQFPLPAFSESETLKNLQLYFPDVSNEDAEEFHRLTSANPRVQANAFAAGSTDITKLLSDLGPSVITVEAQIQQQLELALDKLKSNLPPNFHQYLNNICTGLASLSPNIPLQILAQVASVEISAVKSFVTDIGRSLWLLEDSVQFRDEPTETWFRQKFSADKDDFVKFISDLEPLASQSSYAAQVLPQLYLQAEQYDKLIKIALSDEFLPTGNPIDERTIRVYRLQFALKAALKINELKDACKLALRAGEETAGNERQVGLLKQNIDLLVLLQSKEKVQTMAMRRELSGFWEGSANVYSASLLSSIPDFKGEARSFLRSAENWLKIYFDTPKENNNHEEDLRPNDLLEIAYARLNLNGIDSCLSFLTTLNPKPVIARIFGLLVARLIDNGQYETIGRLLQKCKKEPLFILALNGELVKVGRFCEKPFVETAIKLINKKTFVIDNNIDDIHDKPDLSFVALAEAAVHYKLPNKEIAKLIEGRLPTKATHVVTHSYHSHTTSFFLRAFAIRNYLLGVTDMNIEPYLPVKFTDKKPSYEEERELTDYKETIGGLMPWYVGRLEVIANGGTLDPLRLNQLATLSNNAMGHRYRSDDPIPRGLATAHFEILKFASLSSETAIKMFYDGRIKENKKVLLRTWIAAVRWSHRLEHLVSLRNELENYAYSRIKADRDSGPDELASDYISLARAVAITSTDNASVYFDNAVEIVSKFGDEMIRRWEALTALANRAADRGSDQQKLSYRFIRVAELVGQDLREKHWSRGEAVQLAIGLSPNGGISALSRWRDRDIGRFEWLVNSMLIKLAESTNLTAVQAWGFTPFCSTESLPHLVKGFLKSTGISVVDKNIILDDAIKRLRCELVTNSYWYDLEIIKKEFDLESAELQKILNQLTKEPKEKTSGSHKDRELLPDLDWDEIFNGHNLLTVEGITAINESLKRAATEKQFHLGRYILPLAVIPRLNEKDVAEFIETFIKCDWVENYDIASLFEHLSVSIFNRPAFLKKLPGIIDLIGVNFALELTNDYGFSNMLKALPGPAEKASLLKNGIFKGMIENQEFAGAENLFDLVRLAADNLTPADAAEALDYALERFELHVDEELGDGPWALWLETEGSAVTGITGFLWSALGSPRSETRWRAAHTVKKIAELGEIQLLTELFRWSELMEIKAYGCIRYSFYSRHALQYLLIACARISLKQPCLLKTFEDRIKYYALNYEHIIIQKFAANAALNIAGGCPGIFTEKEITELKLVGKSPFPPATEENDDDLVERDSFDDSDSEESLGYYFGYDFSRYWLGDLGDEFAMPQKQMVDRTASIIVNEWGLTSQRYDDDPRVELWNRNRDDYRTSYSHGSYPRDDNFIFYTSYHAMMVVAARLLKGLPIVSDEDSIAISWDKWLAQHLVTRYDGYWLSDWKDPLPLHRPGWENEDFKVWQPDIKSVDIVANLVAIKDGIPCLTIAGGWEEELNSRREVYSVRSALVSTETSDALMRALDTCADPHDFKLPNYKEENMEIDHGPFKLEGWIVERNFSAKLDEYDPFAEDLPFPPYAIGKDFVNALGLNSKQDGKAYFRKDNIVPAIYSEQWSSGKEYHDKEPAQRGIRINATIEFLAEVCKSKAMEIILEVQVSRNLNLGYRSGQRDDHQSPIHKIFILSADGEIRDSERNYSIR